MRNPLRLAVIAESHLIDVLLPFPPVWMQKLGLMMAAPLGRRLGYEPTYATTGLKSVETAGEETLVELPLEA